MLTNVQEAETVEFGQPPDVGTLSLGVSLEGDLVDGGRLKIDD